MLTILVIDDNVHLQIAFKKVLSSSGYGVELAGDGEEGLHLAHTIKPDVILLDMMLPKLSGLEVLLALKNDPTTERIPVIALSGLPSSNDARLRRDGAVSYLQKSNLEDLDVLLQAIDYALLTPRSDEFSEVAFHPNSPSKILTSQPPEKYSKIEEH
jgi:CheY-like chemotaxis protein